jgi:hypothetical protein
MTTVYIWQGGQPIDTEKLLYNEKIFLLSNQLNSPSGQFLLSAVGEE